MFFCLSVQFDFTINQQQKSENKELIRFFDLSEGLEKEHII